MAQISDGKTLAGVGITPTVQEAMDRWERCNKWYAQANKLFLDDLKFAEADSDNGFQWPNSVRRNRDLDERPCLTINKTRQHNLHIINAMKQNKQAIAIKPTGNGATAEMGTILSAWCRQVEYESNAGAAYATAAGFMVKAGRGYVRVKTKYEDPKTNNQTGEICRVDDPLTIFIDPEAKELDKSDMMFAFVFEDKNIDEFKKANPQWAKYATSGTIGNTEGWMSDEKVRICEYYRRVEEKFELYSIVRADPQTGQQSMQYIDSRDPRYAAAPELLKALREESEKEDSGVTVRDSSEWKVEYKFIVGVHEIESEASTFPGLYIPIVPMVAEETVIQGVYDCKGHTRALKDAQRMYNYWSPLSLDTYLPTPTGWTTMGDAAAGDWLLDEHGKPVQVIGVSPIHLNRDCFKIQFDDGSHIVADGEHLWTVEERGTRKASTWNWSTKTVKTAELTAKKHFIYATEALDLPLIDLPIHPYLLGAWLGDGTTAEPSISSGLNDIDEMRKLLQNCGYVVGLPRVYNPSAGLLTVHEVRKDFTDLGLLGNKHIPAIYLRASRLQRLELLQGLMDTDGSISANKQCSFTTVNLTLMEGFSELLASLGIKAVYCEKQAQMRAFPSGNSYECKMAYQFSFTADPTVPVFKLERKADIQQEARETHPRRTKRHRIVSVTPVKSVPVKCVTIDSESHLFLAGPSMIPTHNSTAVEYGALQTKTPWIAPAEAIEDYEVYWNNANKNNNAVLPYNALADDGTTVIPPPQRIQPPVAAPVALQGMQTASMEMQMVSGQYDNTMAAPGNERTGAAIDARSDQGEQATAHYQDAQAACIRHVGRILLGLAPIIMDTQRLISCMGEDGKSFEVMVDPQQQQALAAKMDHMGQVVQQILVNPNIGRYNVQADSGPAYGTRRKATVDAMALILTQAPQLTGIIGDIMVRNMDMAEANEASERLRRMVPPQALGTGPSMQEQQLQETVKKLNEALTATTTELAHTQIKLKGKDARRDVDVFNAMTKRVQVLLDATAKKGESGGSIPMADVKVLIDQAMAETLNTSLDPVLDATAPTLESAAGEGGGNRSQISPSDVPPVPGARKGDDGHWYVRHMSESNAFSRVL